MWHLVCKWLDWVPGFIGKCKHNRLGTRDMFNEVYVVLVSDTVAPE